MIIANHLTDKINQKCGQKSKITSYQRRDGSLPDLENYLNENPEKKRKPPKDGFQIILIRMGYRHRIHPLVAQPVVQLVVVLDEMIDNYHYC